MGLRDNSQSKKKLEISTPQNMESSIERTKHYHDSDVELDAIERLRSNILMLDDLQQRLRFMNNEIESLVGLKKK